MNKVLYTLIVLGLFTVCNPSHGQDHSADSLLTVISSKIDDTSKVNALNDLGWLFRNKGEVQLALNYLTQAAELAKKTGYVVGEAKALNRLGVAYIDKGDYNTGLKLYKEALQKRNELKDIGGVASVLNNIGLVYQYTGDYNRALKTHLTSLRLRSMLKDTSAMAASYVNLGLVYKVLGDFNKALDYEFKSLQINEQLGMKQGQAIALSGISRIYREIGNYGKAKAYILKCLELQEEIGDKRGVSESYSNLGTLLQAQERESEALNYFEKSLSYNSEIGNKAGLALDYGNIGNCFFSLNKTDSAYYFNLKSLKLSEEIGDEEGVCLTSASIAECLMKLNKMEEAFGYINRGLGIANKIGRLGNRIKLNHLFFRYYQARNDANKALFYFEQYVLLKEQEEQIEKQNETALKAARYEYNKQHIADSLNYVQVARMKNIQLAEQQTRLKNEKMQRYGLYGGLLLVLVFAFIIYNRLKVTREQNTVIENQRLESEKQKEIIQEKQKEIIDSITYAQRLQKAILPQSDFIKEVLPQSFVLYKPKDIVAGDFYWIEKKGNYIFVAAADCTGHGVPGAMVSVVCSNALNAALNEFNLTDTGKILDKTTDLVLETFGKGGAEIKDGMDISLARIEILNTGTDINLQWSGANNPLWIIERSSEQPIVNSKQQTNNNETISQERYYSLLANGCSLKEIKANKQPIGQFDVRVPFTTHLIKLQKGDSFYLYTDGYADQFGGNSSENRRSGGKKFKYKQLGEALMAICNKPLEEQANTLDVRFEDWKGELEQVDDVCVIGVRL